LWCVMLHMGKKAKRERERAEALESALEETRAELARMSGQEAQARTAAYAAQERLREVTTERDTLRLTNAKEFELRCAAETRAHTLINDVNAIQRQYEVGQRAVNDAERRNGEISSAYNLASSDRDMWRTAFETQVKAFADVGVTFEPGDEAPDVRAVREAIVHERVREARARRAATVECPHDGTGYVESTGEMVRDTVPELPSGAETDGKTKPN
jgi:hypothetical protein